MAAAAASASPSWTHGLCRAPAYRSAGVEQGVARSHATWARVASPQRRWAHPVGGCVGGFLTFSCLAASRGGGGGGGGGSRRLRRRWRLRRRASGSDAPAVGVAEDVVEKLGTLLKKAVEVEADGKPVEELLRAEKQAKDVLIFTGNGFRAFGAATQVPKRVYTNEELEKEGVRPKKFLQVEDVVGQARVWVLRVAAVVSLLGIWALRPTTGTVYTILTALLLGVAADTFVNSGVLQALVLDALAGIVAPDYRNRTVQHEAARFLVGYLLGVLPKSYTLSASDALSQYQSPKMRQGCLFCTASFQSQLDSGKVSGETLDKYVCIKLAGIAQEHMIYEQAQTGASYLQQVEELFRVLGFEQRRSSDQTRWAVLNVVTLLRRHRQIHAALVRAMTRGASIEVCISLIEQQWADAPEAAEAPAEAAAQA